MGEAVIVRLMDRARLAGLALQAEGDRLVVEGTQKTSVNLMAELSAHKVELIALITANDRNALGPTPRDRTEAEDNGPLAPCPDCNCHEFWRLSVLSGGPGPWTCKNCTPPDPDVWPDAHVLPA